MAEEIVVRAAERADADAVARLVHAAYTPYIGRIGRHPAPMLADYILVIAAGHTWVAEHEGAIVGVLVLVTADDHLLIDNIAVAPESQEIGVGSRLLAHAEQEARRQGLSELRLYTNQAMTENIAYYPRRGFHEIGRANTDGYDRVFFSKSLSKPG